MDTTTIAVIVVAVLIVAGFAAWFIYDRQRSNTLRQRFGPEYDYTVSKIGDRRKAEDELSQRQKRVEALEIHRLSPENREHFLGRWRAIQTEFVNDPSGAVKKADQLIQEVMLARGFPMNDFESRAADISAVHPNVVQNYRAAQAIAKKNEADGAGTEELRQGFIHYRALFEELLERQVELRGKAV